MNQIIREIEAEQLKDKIDDKGDGAEWGPKGKGGNYDKNGI